MLAAGTSVSSVDVTSPPMTTVASGRCTSAPVPCESATGMKPRLATSAVIRTGRSRSRAPPSAAASGEAPPVRCALDGRQEDQAVEHRDAEQRDETDAAETRTGAARAARARARRRLRRTGGSPARAPRASTTGATAKRRTAISVIDSGTTILQARHAPAAGSRTRRRT